MCITWNVTLHASRMEWSWYHKTQARQAKQNAVESKLKSCAECLFIWRRHLTRASHPPAAFKHLILISTNEEHSDRWFILTQHLFAKAALHLSINRGTRSIVTSACVGAAACVCSPGGGLPAASWLRARAPARNRRSIPTNYPRLGRVVFPHAYYFFALTT